MTASPVKPTEQPEEPFPLLPDKGEDARHIQMGRRGETLAARNLWKKGYRILQRNFRVPQGEIDIIAEKKGRIHFVEVKTRSSDYGGEPEERVDAEKKARLRRAGQAWLANFREPPAAGAQHDVYAIVLDGKNNIQKEKYIPKAF